MKSRKLTASAANGPSKWLDISSMEAARFALAIGVFPAAGATLSAKVQSSLDDPNVKVSIAWARSGTTVTVTDAAHGLSNNDEVAICAANDAALNSSGGTSYPVTVIDANTYSFTCSGGVAAASGTATVAKYRPVDHDTLTGLTARAVGNYEWPVMAVRLMLSGSPTGPCDLVIVSLAGLS